MKFPKQQLLTNYHIKWLAIITMVIDHVGELFFPDEDIFRIIGRLSFPLFAWLLVQGEAHTRNVQKYGLRLIALGVVTEPIYRLTFDPATLNIMFTLALGLICLRLSRRYRQWALPIWAAAAVIAEIGMLGFGAYGIGIIALLAVFRNTVWWWSGWAALHLALYVYQPWYGIFQIPALAAPLLLLAATHTQGPKSRWFYAVYPLHMLVLYLIDRLI